MRRIAILLVLAGCSDSLITTDELSDDCDDESATPLALDEVSPLGFAPKDLLALAKGEHAVPIRWADEIAPGVTGLSESGEGRGTLSVTYASGAARYVDSKNCDDRVEVDVSVSMVSESGALDETFAATLAGTPWGATIEHGLGKLRGDLRIVGDEARADGYDVRLWFTPSSAGGRILGTIVLGQGDEAGVTQVELASLGPASSCAWGLFPIAMDEEVRGRSPRAMVERVTTGPYDFLWNDEPAGPAELSFTATPACYVVAVTNGRVGVGISVEGTLDVRGGPIDVHVPVRMFGTEDGDLSTLLLDGNARSVPGAAVDLGNLGVDLGAYDGGFVSAGGIWSDKVEGGGVTVGGVLQPECQKHPPVCTDTECDGCEGETVVELGKGTFRRPE